jgi:polyhydroxyalkanoate synthesis regulator phasin
MAEDRNLFQEGLYVGLGLALRTQEMIEDFANKVTKEYKMSEEEGRRFAEDLVKESEETRTRLDEMVENRIKQYMDDLNVAKKDDLDSISKKLADLEKKLDKK